MSTESFANPVSHADLTYPLGHSQTFEEDRAAATSNIDCQYPDYRMNGMLADSVAVIMRSERSRRNGHYYRYRNLFAMDESDRILTAGESIVETSLLDIDERIQQMTPKQFELAQAMGGKGISAELGHVDQFANWNAGRRLDAAVRSLPTSESLEAAGFVFADTYGDKETAKISYRIHLANEAQSPDDDGTPHGTVLKAVRKRAAADILTTRGDSYEVVKMSSYLIHSSQLGRKYLEDIQEIIKLSGSKNDDQQTEARLLMDSTGKEIVEPFIVHPEFRAISPGVLAVSSLYFALHRHK